MPTQRKTRSRKGCHACKKGKMKCDEKRPICSNCLKLHRRCDYSMILTWGGRPYKKPKVEKLNTIATISRNQLNCPASNISLPFDSFQAEIKKTAPKAVKLEDVGLDNPGSSSSTKFLNPSGNLQYLLRMSGSSMEDVPMANNGSPLRATAYSLPPPSLPPTSLPPTSLPSPSIAAPSLPPPSLPPQSPSPSQYTSLEEPLHDTPHALADDHHLNENIKSISNVLGNIINDHSIQTNPWSFLEDLSKSQIFPLEQPTTTDTIASSLPPELLSMDNTPLPNSSISESPYRRMDDFAYDIQRIEEHSHSNSTSNLHSIPIINEKRHRKRLRDVEEEEEQQQQQANSIFSNALLPSYHSARFPPSPSTTSSESIETIPRGLLPLPDMLLNVPYYCEAFNFFMNSTSLLFTPADASIYANNPFKMVLPNLAMCNDGLMSMLVAFGVAHRNTLLHQEIPTDVVESLMSRALRDLLALLDNSSTSTSDLTLTLVMLLSSFMVFTFKSDKWRVHLKGARQILLLRGYSKPFSKLITDFRNDDTPADTYMNNEIKKSRLLFFLIRWFAYIDIFTNLSGPLEPTDDEVNRYLQKRIRLQLEGNSGSPTMTESTLDSSAFDELDGSQRGQQQQQQQFEDSLQPSPDQLSPQIPVQQTGDQQIDYNIAADATFMKEESHKDIDYILGFNIKFLPLYSQICKLIKHINIQKRIQAQDQGNSRFEFKVSPKVIERSLQIEMQFRKLGKIEFDTDYTTNSKSFNSIVASNRCFLLMGLIQLYRRVLQIPRKSKLVQEMSASIAGLTQDFIDTKKSPSSLCLILPIFVGGCECDDPKDRQIYRANMKDMASQGSPSAAVASEIMEQCWVTGRDWYEIMYTENRTVVFL